MAIIVWTLTYKGFEVFKKSYNGDQDFLLEMEGGGCL